MLSLPIPTEKMIEIEIMYVPLEYPPIKNGILFSLLVEEFITAQELS
jgi:hypothetical protein